MIVFECAEQWRYDDFESQEKMSALNKRQKKEG